jgi:hypothetical protein
MELPSWRWEGIAPLSAAYTHSDAGDNSGRTHIDAGNVYDWRDGDDKPCGERRVGRRIATYLYRDHLGGPHTRVEKWSAPGKRAQYPQSFWLDGRWIREKPAGLELPGRSPGYGGWLSLG